MGRECLRLGLYKKENTLVGERERKGDPIQPQVSMCMT
jgi:hypothetical protein